MKKFLSFMLCMVMILTSIPAAAQAKTKTVTAYNTSMFFFEDELAKVPSVSSGTNNVKLKHKDKSIYLVKFKAPKKGTYKFKFSAATSKDDASNGDAQTFSIYNADFDVKKMGGLKGYYDDEAFCLVTKQGYNIDKEAFSTIDVLKDSYKRHEKRDTYYPSKTVSLKLSKGAVIYICCNPRTDNGSYKLNISRK